MNFVIWVKKILILKKEKEITSYKNIIKNKIIELLKNNDNCLCIDNNEVLLNEYNMKQLDTKKVKDNYPDVYNDCIKNIRYEKMVIKEK